jgi:zinc protease
VVSLELVFRTGNGANPREQAGLASLCARLLAEGTAKRSGPEITDELAVLGASLGAQAGWDALSVSVSSLSESFVQAAEIWADVVQSPRFDEAALARVRDDLVSRLSRRRGDAGYVADQVLARLLFGDAHPYGRPELGTEESLRRLTPADLGRFHRGVFRPANAVLIAAGDITERALRSELGRLFGAWKAAPALAVAPLPPPAPPPAKPSIALVDGPEGSSATVRLGLPGIARRSPDYHAALVMNHLLGGSAKRLDRLLREQRGWAVGVRSVFEARRSPGPWIFRAEVTTAQTGPAVAELLKALRALRDGDPTVKELEEAKQEILDAFPARFATVHQVAAQMATLAVYGVPEAELAAFPRKIAAVTPAAVRQAARKYLQPERAVIVVVGERKQLEPVLRKLGEVQLRDADGAPRVIPVAEGGQGP